MNKFEAYNASQIVPQVTLLKKFNALIKYLSDNPNVNIYKINTDYVAGTLVYNLSDVQLPTIDGVKATLEVGDWLNFNGAYQAIVQSVGETTVTITEAYSIKGANGETGNGIEEIILVSQGGEENQYRIKFTNGSFYDYSLANGENGIDGNGIQKIVKTGEEGYNVYYTIYFTNGSTYNYTITNGTDGTDGTDGNGILSVTLYATAGLAKTYRMTFTDGSHFDYVVRDGATGGGIGINTLVSVDFTFTNIVQTSAGFEITGNAEFTYTDDTGAQQSTHTATYSYILPIKGNSGVVVDITEDGKAIEIRLDSSIQEDIDLNTENISKNTTDIATANTNISKNTADIATANTNISKNTTDIGNINSQITLIKASITQNTNDIVSAKEDITANANSIELIKGNGWNGETLVTRQVKKKLFTDVSVATSAFATDTTYTDYGYKVTIALSGVVATDFADVVLGVTEATSGVYAPVVETYAGGIYLYASEVPPTAVVIPSIVIWG